MSIRYLSPHRVQPGETVIALVEKFGLGCREALSEISSNRGLNLNASPEDALPAGCVIQIPPDARQLVRNRIYALHAFRPKVVSHFDIMQARMETQLLPLLADTRSVERIEKIGPQLELFEAEVQSQISGLSVLAQPLVPICEALSCTYVAENDDFAALNASQDPMCGMYWSVSPPALELWQGVWAIDLWADKWSEKDATESQRVTAQFLTTVRSIVTQKIDQRLRSAQSLQRKIEADFAT